MTQKPHLLQTIQNLEKSFPTTKMQILRNPIPIPNHNQQTAPRQRQPPRPKTAQGSTIYHEQHIWDHIQLPRGVINEQWASDNPLTAAKITSKDAPEQGSAILYGKQARLTQCRADGLPQDIYAAALDAILSTANHVSEHIYITQDGAFQPSNSY